MTSESIKAEANDKIGCGRPPVHARWKKGECGNPKRIRKRRVPKSTVELIDGLLLEKTRVREDGKTRRITRFELIVRQLLVKAHTDARARQVLLQYQAFAVARDPESCRTKFEVVVVPDKERR